MSLVLNGRKTLTACECLFNLMVEEREYHISHPLFKVYVSGEIEYFVNIQTARASCFDIEQQ